MYMGKLDPYKPAICMIILQFTYAGVALFTRAILVRGMSPRVFVAYRQAIATIILAPIAYITPRNSCNSSLRLKSYCWIFVSSLIGVTGNQNAYFEGLYLASSTVTSAMSNLIPAITFVMATTIGLEKVNMKSLRSISKIVGTMFCVSGAGFMALLKGPKLLNAEILPTQSIFGLGSDNNWLLGCGFLFGSSCLWSFWIITLVPISAACPDHLYTSTWMLFMATLQSAVVAYFTEEDATGWTLRSFLQLACCVYTGFASALSFVVQAWCVAERGPVYTAMFNPLSTIIVAIFASIFLHEEMHVGSLLGGLAVIAGLYIVLWGKAKDLEKIQGGTKKNLQYEKIIVAINGSSGRAILPNDLEEPLVLSDKSTPCDQGSFLECL